MAVSMSNFSSWLRVAGAYLACGAVVVGVIYTIESLFRIVPEGRDAIQYTLPLLAISGIVVLVLVLTIVATIFQFLGLSNKTQAMGLPEGSIRSVIALSLIVLFAILAVFLFERVSNGPSSIIRGLSQVEFDDFIKQHGTAKGIQSLPDTPVLDKDKNPVMAADGKTPLVLHNLSYESDNRPASDDVAKQLLVLLGTLMTAVTSFYLGAGTATSTQAAAVAATALSAAANARPPPTISHVTPLQVSPSGAGFVMLTITGANLNSVTHVRLTRANSDALVAEKVMSNPLAVTCEVAIPPSAVGDPWDVVVDDGGALSAKWPASVKVVPPG